MDGTQFAIHRAPQNGAPGMGTRRKDRNADLMMCLEDHKAVSHRKATVQPLDKEVSLPWLRATTRLDRH